MIPVIFSKNIELAEVILKKEGYNLFFAMDAAEVSQVLSTHNIDVIVLDLMLPDIDGFSILKTIKGNSKYANIEVIVVSALNDLHSIEKAKELGASDYICKPYDIISLKLKVKEILKRSKLQKFDIERFLDEKFTTMVLDEKNKKSIRYFQVSI